MAKIAYALAGEGRGHATRARAIADGLLRGGAEIVFLTAGDALAYLGQVYREHPRVRFIEIPILRFAYATTSSGARVSKAATARAVVRFMREMPEAVREIADRLKSIPFTPAIMLADYEPLAARVAKRLNVPLVTLDSQHYFAYARLKYLPKRLWGYSLLVKATCWWMAPKKSASVISKFVPPEYIRKAENVYSVGPLIRPELKKPSPAESDFVLCYLRPSVGSEVLAALRSWPGRVVVYGLGGKPAEGHIEYCEVSAENFARDLLSCRAVVGTAGSQLITECLFLRKKFWTYPEPGQMEQIINGVLASQLGIAVAKPPIEKNLIEFLKTDAPANYPATEDGTQRTVDLVLKLAGAKPAPKNEVTPDAVVKSI